MRSQVVVGSIRVKVLKAEAQATRAQAAKVQVTKKGKKVNAVAVIPLQQLLRQSKYL